MKRIQASIFAAALIGLSGHAGAEPAAPASSAAHSPKIITNPDWAAQPNSDQMASAYPRAAQAAHVTGFAHVQCYVAADGSLYGCVLLSESPAGWGFGAATLKIAPLFRMKPMTVDGKPVDGGAVIVPVSWAIGNPQQPPMIENPSSVDLGLARKLAKLAHANPAASILNVLYGADVVPAASKMGSDALAVQVGGQAAPMSRASRRSSFARPYIWRLTSLSLVTWPSV